MSATSVIEDFLAGRPRSHLATELWKRYRPKAPDRARDARSLAKEIRRLEEGDVTWFLKRPEAARQLAKIIGCNLASLGILLGEHLAPFVDFPVAAPLDLATEDPHLVEAWIELLNGAVGQPVWFSGPPGIGKTLFARWAEARGLAARIVATTLAEVDSSLARSATTTIVDLSSTSPADVGASQRLARKGLVVLAPASRPRSEEDPGNWLDLQWSAEGFDRDAFIEWLAKRVPDAPRSAAQLLRRLQDFDPDGTLLTTPDDVVQFAGAVYDNRRAGTVVDAVLHRAAEAVASGWLKAHGRDLYRCLAVERWRDLRIPYGQAAPTEVWRSYVPDRLLAPKDRAGLEAELRAVRAGAKFDVAEVADRLQRDAATTIKLLESARILVPSPGGGLVLRPRWLAHAEAVENLKDQLLREPAAACAVAVDASRRSVVDRVCMRFDDLAFGRFLRGLPASANADLHSVAASETAFAAVARRRASGRTVKSTDILTQLVRRQVDVLVERHREGQKAPVTRPGAGSLGGNAFVADCWDWSTWCQKPPAIAYEPWLFPGWEAVPPLKLPNWLHSLDVEGSGNAAVRLGSALDVLLARWTPVEWASVPGWMLPAMLTAEREWPLEEENLGRLHADRVAQELRSRIDRLTPERRQVVVRRLWVGVSPWALHDVLRLLQGVLGAPMLADVETECVASALSRWQRAIPHDLGAVPAPLRAILVRAQLATDAEQGERKWWSQVDHLGPDEADLLVELARGDGGWMAVRRLWLVAPRVAEIELAKRLAEGGDRAIHWIDGPIEATPHILDLVEKYAPPRSAWLRWWAARRILEAPFCAMRLHRLLG